MTSDMADRATEVAVPDFAVPEARLITARSFLIDRAVPDCETILMPGYRVPGGVVRCGLTSGATLPEARRGSRWMRLLRRPSAPQTVPSGALYDARHLSPGNWSHFLNIHLPTLFIALDRLDIAPDDVTIILPADIPGYIRGACAIFGMETRATDGAVTGTVLQARPDPIGGLRAGWTMGLRETRAGDRLRTTIARTTTVGDPLPERVFLARQDTRRISNQKDIEALLQPRGFRTIYPETLSPVDQFRLFHEAREMVAVHGAGLAPLLYRPETAPPMRLVEILPTGHMTNVTRTMCAQAGIDWTGVRGRIAPGQVTGAYDLTRPIFNRHSLDDFTVDPVSVERALAGAGA